MFDVGVTLGNRYLLVSLVARGGMGEVWSAQDIVLDRRVAVKVLLPSLAGDAGFEARFRAEARAMAALSHPGIIEIYDYGQADGLAYLVMQFIEGESLVSLIRRSGPISPERAMRLVSQAAEAIDAAHRQGIVHRDVKPANLLVRNDGRLALTDFGIARILATDRLTGADQIVGTSSYLAPEQVTGEEITPATDVYALGVVAYELLTGEKPFTADTPFGVALMHVHEEPPPLPGSVPQPIRELVDRAMAKDPAQRWPSAAALAWAASAAIEEANTSATADAVAEPGALPRRRPRSVSGGAVAPAGNAARPAGNAARSGGRAIGPGDRVIGPGGEVIAVSGEVIAVSGDGTATGEATRTTRRNTPAWDEAEQPAPSPAGRRLLVAGAAVATLAVATALIVFLSTNGSGRQPQTEGPQTSSSPASAAPATPPAQGPTPAPSGTRNGTPGSTPPADPARSPMAARTSTPAASATVPRMYGWREHEMVSELRRLGLVERITYRSTPDQCYVVEQSPAGGTVLPTGSTVNVVVAKATDTCREV